MFTKDLSQQSAERIARTKEVAKDVQTNLPTIDYIPWEDCLSDCMLNVLFKVAQDNSR